MENFKAEALGTAITFSNITKIVEKRNEVIIVEVNNKNYGMIKRLVEQSNCLPTTELKISRDGKWLIPSDVQTTSSTPDW